MIPLGNGSITAANTGGTVPAITPNSAVACQGNSSSGAGTITIPAGLTWSGTVHIYESNDGVTLTQVGDNLILNRETLQFGPIPSGATDACYQFPTSAGQWFAIAEAWVSGTLALTLASGSGLVPLSVADRATHFVPAPGNFNTTDWVLPSGCKYIWTQEAVGVPCTIYIADQFGTIVPFTFTVNGALNVNLAGPCTVKSQAYGSTCPANIFAAC